MMDGFAAVLMVGWGTAFGLIIGLFAGLAWGQIEADEGDGT